MFTMRGAAILGLVTVAGCAEATGIVLRVDPVDQAVKGADTLEVYVGRDTVVIEPKARDPIRVHFDDGRMTAFELTAAFTSPVDVLLDGDGSEAPFWVTVRALDDGVVIGEGGVGTELQIVAGEVGLATAAIERSEGEPAFMPNCPGFHGDGGLDHYIVGELETDDCDADLETAANGDCDDFDPSFNTRAQDLDCDGLDHTCDPNPRITTTACVFTDGGGCRLGTQTCDDATGALTTPCVEDITAPLLPDAVCTACQGTMRPLIDCLRDVSAAQCDIAFTPAGFCLPANQSAIAFDIWYQDNGPPVSPGVARWFFDNPADPLAYGWVESQNQFVPDQTTQLPPWPSVKTGTGPPLPLTDGRHDSLLLVVNDGGGGRTAFVVDFIYHQQGADECPDDAAPDCVGIPGP